MRCVVCKHGDMKEGKATVTLERGGTTVIIRDVPALVCENCGEYYLSEEVTAKVMQIAEESVKRGVEIEVLRFAA